MISYRFKTEKEFKEQHLWDSINGTPISWNKNRIMNHLMGKEITFEYHKECKDGLKFIYEDEISNRKWNISSIHYTAFDKNSNAVAFPREFTQMEQDRRQHLEAGPMFDIGRLAGEIDAIFDKKLKASLEIQSGINNQAIDKAKIQMDDYLNKIKDTYKDIREELLAEVSRGRTTIILNETSQIDIRHMDHPKMEDVIKSLHLNHKVMLVGPAGTGKTYMVAEIANRLNLPFYKYSCSRDSSVHDLLGYKQPRSEEYLETVFLKAYENGGIFLVDKVFVQTY